MWGDAGLDFAYPEAAKIGGLISGPPQRGDGTKESPSGWLIVLETWSPPSAVSNDVSGAPGDVSEGDPVGAPQNGRVDRQMVWGGCVGLVLKGRVKMEPLIAQVPPSALHISVSDYRMNGQIYSSISELPGTTCMTVVLMVLAALHMQCI